MKIYKKILALALLTAAALSLTSCAAGQTAEQPEYAMLTISEPSGSFDFGLAELTLYGCDVGEDSITLNFSGLIPDEDRDGIGSLALLSSAKHLGYSLQVGDELFTEGSVQEVSIEQTVILVDMEFNVSASSLTPGKKCSLVYHADSLGDYRDLIKFTLTGAADLQSFMGAQAFQKTDDFSVAASAIALGDGYTCVKLYSESSGGLELMSYGVGGGSDVPEDVPFNQLGLLDEFRGLSLRTSAETLYPQGLQYSWDFPSSFAFETGDETEFTLYLPYVVYRGREDMEDMSHGKFNGIQEGVYSESIPLEYGALNFSLQRSPGGALCLCCSAERTDETLRLCGLDYVVNGSARSMALRQIEDAESPEVFLTKGEDNILEAGTKIEITGVYYAQVVDLEIPLTTN